MHSALPKTGIVGVVELYSLDRRGRFDQLLWRERNLVTYEGYDALGAFAAGDLLVGINAMYVQFDQTGVGTTRTAAITDTAADFRALSGDVDFLRIRMRGGVTSASSGNFASNKAAFDITAVVGLLGEQDELEFAESVAVEKLGLVIAPDWADNTQDRLYASYALSSPQVVSGSGIGIRWQTQFGS